MIVNEGHIVVKVIKEPYLPTVGVSRIGEHQNGFGTFRDPFVPTTVASLGRLRLIEHINCATLSPEYLRDTNLRWKIEKRTTDKKEERNFTLVNLYFLSNQLLLDGDTCLYYYTEVFFSCWKGSVCIDYTN